MLLVCTDGMWAQSAATRRSRSELALPGTPLREKLLELAERAVARAGAASDNTSAAALRWLARDS